MPVLLIVAAAVCAGCAIRRVDVPTPARAPRPVPAEIARLTAPPPPSATLVFRLLEDGDGYRRWRFEVPTGEGGVSSVRPSTGSGRTGDAGGETEEDAAAGSADADEDAIAGELFLSRRPGPRPLLVLHPIFGGNYALERLFGRWFARDGFHAYFVIRRHRLLADPATATDWDAQMADTLRAARGALAALAALPAVDGARLGNFGISLGAVTGALLAAVEPRLSAHALLLGGAGLESLLANSRERAVVRYLERRARRCNVTPADVAREIGAGVRFEPAALAGAVDSRAVLLVFAALDRSVPPANGRALYEALGRPETLLVDAGHYDAVRYLPVIYPRVQAFFARRFAAGRGAGD